MEKDVSNSSSQSGGVLGGQAQTQRTTTEVPSNAPAAPDLTCNHGGQGQSWKVCVQRALLIQVFGELGSLALLSVCPLRPLLSVVWKVAESP